MPTIDLTLIGLPGGFLPRGNLISDAEAKVLYEAWRSSPPGEDLSIANVHAKPLVSKGLLRKKSLQGSAQYSLTPEGRKILVEMVTNEPSRFCPDSNMPPYREIKAKAARARRSFIKKAIKQAQMGDLIRNEQWKSGLEGRLKDLVQSDPEAAEDFAYLIHDPDDPRSPQQILDDIIKEVLQDMQKRSKFKQEWQQVQDIPAGAMASHNVVVKVAGF